MFEVLLGGLWYAAESEVLELSLHSLLLLLSRIAAPSRERKSGIHVFGALVTADVDTVPPSVAFWQPRGWLALSEPRDTVG